MLTKISMRSNLFFSRTLAGPSWTHHLEGARLLASRPASENQVELAVQTLAGTADPAFRIVQWKGAHCPTLIYHHGHSEAAFDFSERANNSFRHMFLMGDAPVEANWIVLRAPYHQGPLSRYLEHMVHLSHYMAMLAASVMALEEAVKISRNRGGAQSRVYLAGLGLGGFAVNLHRVHFNSATGYIPLLAGTALGDAFVQGEYRRLMGALPREYPGQVRDRLNFEDAFAAVPTPNVFPFLARYDRMVPWERQSQSYAPHTPVTVNKGHMTCLMTPKHMRRHILRSMQLGE